MSRLPQRKKSAEEIAKLRENLGIPVAGEITDALVENPPEPVSLEPPAPVAFAETIVAEEIPTPPVDALEPVDPAREPLSPLPVSHSHPPRPVRSLKRSERIPVLPVEDIEMEEQISETPSQAPKPVRSLRKAEQMPVTLAEVHSPPAHSTLPVHRHSDEELSRIRRQSVMMSQGQVHPLLAMKAHPALVIPGYLAAFGGAASFYYYELSIGITAGCVVVAFALAAFISLKKPLSRHHAAFISMIAVFVIIFGALYYFPNLQHGT